MGEAAALLAVGHVALAASDRAGAARAAAPGRDGGPWAPRPRRMAEALELEGRPAATERARHAALEQAVAIWHELSNPRGRHAPSGPCRRRSPARRGAAAAREAEARPRQPGARRRRAAGGPTPPRRPPAIEALGRSRFCADGRAGAALGVVLV